MSQVFDDEKKLGSFFVRLLPVLLSINLFLDLKKFNSYIILIAGYVIFLSSERTALFLYIILMFSYFLIIKNKIKFLIISSFIIFIFFVQ